MLNITNIKRHNSLIEPGLQKLLWVILCLIFVPNAAFAADKAPTFTEIFLLNWHEPALLLFVMVSSVIVFALTFRKHDMGPTRIYATVVGGAVTAYFVISLLNSIPELTTHYMQLKYKQEHHTIKQVYDVTDITSGYRESIIVYSSKSDYYSDSPESFRLGYIEPMHPNKPNQPSDFRLKKFISKNKASSESIFDNTKLNSDIFYMRLAKKREIEILMEKVRDGLVILEDTSPSDTSSILKKAIEE